MWEKARCGALPRVMGGMWRFLSALPPSTSAECHAWPPRVLASCTTAQSTSTLHVLPGGLTSACTPRGVVVAGPGRRVQRPDTVTSEHGDAVLHAPSSATTR